MGLNATKISVKSSELKETNKFHALSKIICPVNSLPTGVLLEEYGNIQSKV